jgi:3-phenylpropionate/trans-cinnamate dioxygenase ferredoxin reductase subunit
MPVSIFVPERRFGRLRSTTLPALRSRGVTEKIIVGEKRESAKPAPAHGSNQDRHPKSIAIIGAGAAGNAAAEMLRREGYTGPLTVFDSDDDAPYDRPNLSKDYLAGTHLRIGFRFTRGRSTGARHRACHGQSCKSLDAAARRLILEDGSSREFGAILLATERHRFDSIFR